MPFPFIPVLGAAASIGSNLISNRATKKREQQARKFNVTQEKAAREWNRENWQMQNKYNHPLQQMERLTSAGLNPNLIYGSSPGSAVGNAGQISPGKGVTGQAPNYQMDNAMIPFMDTTVKQAQSNNLNTAAIKNITSSNLNKAQAKQITDLLSGQVEIQNESVKQSKIKTDIEKLKSKAMSDKDTGIAVRYATETQNLLADNQIKEAQTVVQQLNEFLAGQGIRPGDPLWFRFFGLAFNKGVELSKDMMQKIKEIFNRLKL